MCVYKRAVQTLTAVKTWIQNNAKNFCKALKGPTTQTDKWVGMIFPCC